MERANRETILICQMESLKGVACLEEILQLDGIDGILIGPNDLSQSMGIINQLENPQYLETVEKILPSARSTVNFPVCRIRIWKAPLLAGKRRSASAVGKRCISLCRDAEVPFVQVANEKNGNFMDAG